MSKKIEEDYTCNHDKVYSNCMLLSAPPQTEWICKKCGEEGREYLDSMPTNEYQEIKDKFQNNEEMSKKMEEATKKLLAMPDDEVLEIIKDGVTAYYSKEPSKGPCGHSVCYDYNYCIVGSKGKGYSG